VTGFGVAEVFVENSYRALATPRALGVNQFQHVRRTTDETKVLLDALADMHSPVQGTRYHQHLVNARALGAKILRLADRLLCPYQTDRQSASK